MFFVYKSRAGVTSRISEPKIINHDSACYKLVSNFYVAIFKVLSYHAVVPNYEAIKLAVS